MSVSQSSLILIVEDEEILRATLVDLLRDRGHEIRAVADLVSARAVLATTSPALILLDLTLPDGSGFELLDRLAEEPMAPSVIVLTADTAVDSAVSAVRRGASDYLTKPFSVEVLQHRIDSTLRQRSASLARAVAERRKSLDGAESKLIKLPSLAMQRTYDTIERVARHDGISVLVSGETGVGKESISRDIHDRSARADEAFIAVNCAEFDRGLLRSELFGHERGAFTDASERRAGLFELASRGTLMLDEVSEMPLEVQSLFLRVLEDGAFRRLGGVRELRTNARIVAVTNRSLPDLVEKKAFRQDLLYRLNAVEVRVPPLRERPEDVPILAEHFRARAARALGGESTITPRALQCLLEYRWPGNVRELRNVVERSVLLSGGQPIEEQHLGLSAFRASPPAMAPSAETEGPTADSDILPLEEMERRHIQSALERLEGNRTRAAELLGISRSTLIRKLKKLE